MTAEVVSYNAAAQRRSRERRGEAGRIRERENLQQWRESNPEHHMWLNAQSRAKRAGLPFTIERHHIVIPRYCPYLGVELTNIRRKGKVLTNASLDRIDNTLGYEPGNIEVISYLANMMKNQASREQLVRFAHGVLDRFGG